MHTDEQAGRSARAVSADAYTVGSDIVFASGRYAPETVLGQRLLTHELTHVLQQRNASAGDPRKPIPLAGHDDAERQAEGLGRDMPMPLGRISPVAVKQVARSLQRGSNDPSCTGARAQCATGDECATPDQGHDGGQSASGDLTIELNVDTEADDWETAIRTSKVGHTYLRFLEGNERQYTYGFYPSRGVDENHTQVPGCVHHPDRTHEPCIDERLRYRVNRAQFDAALQAAQRVCRTGHVYGIERTGTRWGPSYTCTTFARDALAAGQQSVPSSTSQATTVFYQGIPPTDNPNTLKENIQAERKQHPERAGYFYNDPCLTGCEQSFDWCTLRGPGGMMCVAQRSACMARCPPGQRSDRLSR